MPAAPAQNAGATDPDRNQLRTEQADLRQAEADTRGGQDDVGPLGDAPEGVLVEGQVGLDRNDEDDGGEAPCPAPPLQRGAEFRTRSRCGDPHREAGQPGPTSAAAGTLVIGSGGSALRHGGQCRRPASTDVTLGFPPALRLAGDRVLLLSPRPSRTCAKNGTQG